MLKSLHSGLYFWYRMNICSNATFIDCMSLFFPKNIMDNRTHFQNTFEFFVLNKISTWKLYALGNNDVINVSWIPNKCCALETAFIILLHVFLECPFPIHSWFFRFLTVFLSLSNWKFPFSVFFFTLIYTSIFFVKLLTAEHFSVFSWMYYLKLTFGWILTLCQC